MSMLAQMTLRHDEPAFFVKRRKGLKADGIVGPVTWNTLF
ncbi:peptidoglycan-binding domain-containing protein [Fictibacillus barbaricus]